MNLVVVGSNSRRKLTPHIDLTLKMAVCFLLTFKKRYLSYGSSDDSPWVLNGMLRNFIDNLLMQGKR